ncbi:MAG: hypothetical protein JO299_16005, partial [Gammaproteobacteria bacterium]|nr:hypothetical protein [Gammaproteobacteria bacterium]
GAATLTAVPPDTPLFKNLEKLGLGSHAERVAQGQVLAHAYTSAIALAIQRRSGIDTTGIVLPDGSFNCTKLAQLSGTAKPR